MQVGEQRNEFEVVSATPHFDYKRFGVLWINQWHWFIPRTQNIL